MSSRRPADDAAAGQPDPKRAKVDAPKPGGFDISSIRAQIAAKKAEAEAKLAAAAPAPSRPAGPSSLPPPPKADPSIKERAAAAKARIEALNTRKSNPYLSGSGSMPKPNEERAPLPVLSSSIALHPLLMGDLAGQKEEKNEKKAMRDRYKPMAPKFSTVKANVATQAKPVEVVIAPQPSLNPYAAKAPAGPSAEEGGVARRTKRQLHFAAPGRFVKQGDALRNEQKMEALRLRIMEKSRKAGLDSEFDTMGRSLKVSTVGRLGIELILQRLPPPDVEWWDKALLPDEQTYDYLDTAMDFLEKSDDSLITHLIQHPIPIPAPGDKKAEERGLMLTKKEQKKMRRQRRMAELEDKRDRQKMGLLPPDPPKGESCYTIELTPVRLANLMKVLTSDAVQDPTKVEAKVRKEVANRATKHEKDNQERKLTTEERKEKEYQLMVARERKGLHGAVFKIRYLTNGRHRFKVRETARTDLLSGICLFSPNFALVLVEGVDKSIKHYKQLMLNRIDWTEQARPMAKGEGEDGEEEKSDEEEGGDLADNKCEMIWEGEVPERTFKQFRARHAETDGSAKEWLTPKWEGMWDLAKRWVWKGEEL